MTSYGDHLYTKNIYSSDTIHWKNFDPPLASEGGDIPTLAAVLEASNPDGDADGHVITNLGNLTMKGDGNIANSDGKITGAAEVDTQHLVTTSATCLEVQIGDELSLGTAGASGGTIAFNSLASQGACSIAGPSSTNQCVVTNCDFTSTSNTFPSSIDDDTLGDVMTRGNTASTNLDMNTHNITGANAISGNNLTATGTTGLQGQIGAERQVIAPIFHVTTPYTGQPSEIESGIEFNSAITTQTSIRGVSETNRTKILNCDLSSTTNLFPTDPEAFEWGAYIFPTVGVSTVSDDEDKKDFGADCYALTAASTKASHRAQLITIQFNITQYSFGTIFIGLDIADADGSNKTGLTARCFFTRFDGKGIQTADRQKVGLCNMTFFVRDDKFYDGNQHRIYPTVATAFDNPGEIRIHFGPNMDTNDPDDNETLKGAVIIQGKPAPSTWRIVDGNPGG